MTVASASPWLSIAVSYGLVFGSLGLLALRSAQRGRRLARQVPEEDRRWM